MSQFFQGLMDIVNKLASNLFMHYILRQLEKPVLIQNKTALHAFSNSLKIAWFKEYTVKQNIVAFVVLAKPSNFL
jgi:hypothetical protein